jgi:phosphoribosylamine--glycine ligase
MGAYAPAPIVSREILREVEDRIIAPTLRGMKEKHHTYKSCLYVGLMITASGPKVIEYNCRFGDPETQVVLPLYDGDIVELLEAACTNSIARLKSAMNGMNGSPLAQSAICVVLASMGYPDEYPTGIEIEGLGEIKPMEKVIAFHAGTKIQRGKLVTAGGRVLGITAMNSTLAGAMEHAYRAVAEIQFQGMQFRRDIGKKAFVH